MDHKTLGGRLAHGDAIDARLAAEKPAIAKLGRSFLAIHRGYRAASAVVAEAEAARDEAVAVVGQADRALDQSVMVLSNDCVTAQLGTRVRPFARFTKYPPSTLIDLPIATEVVAVSALIAAIRKTKPTGPIVKQLAVVEKNVAAVSAALKKLSAPQKAYSAAMSARDALLVDWDKALSSLQRQAAAALDSDEAARALIAPPQAVQVAKQLRAPRKRKAKVVPPA
jgi:hypothetical protein